MLKELVEKLQEMTKQALTPTVMPLDPHEPGHVFWWNPTTGKLEDQAVAYPPRKSIVTTLASLTGAFQRYTADHTPSVWCSMNAVVIVFSDGEDQISGIDGRLHKITLPVAPSPLFALLPKIPTGQKELIGYLRHDLKPAGIEPPTFESTVSSLLWSKSSSTAQDIGTMKSTLGKSASSEVRPKDGSDLPPEIRITFEPFPALNRDLSAEVEVDLSITVDAESEKIYVRPYPGQIEQAQASAVEQLRKKIAELLAVESTVVFAGMP